MWDYDTNDFLFISECWTMQSKKRREFLQKKQLAAKDRRCFKTTESNER